MSSTAAGAARPMTILLCALGGEGGGVLSEWLVAAARGAGFPVQSTSIPGVAQRTGATTYYLEIVPVTHVELGGRTPVLSLHPVPKWDFYKAVESPDHVLTIQTADESLWANLLLTMGCQTG